MRDAPWEVRLLKIQPRISLGDLQRIDNVFDTGEESERVTDVRANASGGHRRLPASRREDDPLGVRAPELLLVEGQRAAAPLQPELRRGRFRIHGQVLDEARPQIDPSPSASSTASYESLPRSVKIRSPSTATLRLRGPGRSSALRPTGKRATRTPRISTEQAPNLARLGRDEDTAGFGVAYDIPNRLNLGLGWRRVESNFQDDPEGRSNRGSFPFFKMTVPGNRGRSPRRWACASSTSRTTRTWRPATRCWGPCRPSGRSGIARDSPPTERGICVDSAVDTGGFFNSSRLGAALSRRSGRGLNVQVFAESGQDEFESAGGSLPGRVDDFRAVGVTIRLPVRKRLVLQLGSSTPRWTRTSTTSTGPTGRCDRS